MVLRVRGEEKPFSLVKHALQPRSDPHLWPAGIKPRKNGYRHPYFHDGEARDSPADGGAAPLAVARGHRTMPQAGPTHTVGGGSQESLEARF